MLLQRALARERPRNGSLIFNRNRQIAAIFTIRIAADSHPPAESEGEIARRIEPGKRREIAREIIDGDAAADERIELDALRQADAHDPARLPMHADGADHRAG